MVFLLFSRKYARLGLTMSFETPQYTPQFKTDTAAQRLNDGMKLTHNQQLDADGYGTTLHDGYSTTDSLQELQTRLRDSLQKVQQSSLSPEAKEDILLSLTKTLERLKQASQKYEQLRQSIRTDLRENLDSLFVTVQDLQQQGKEYF
jgi:hypothetical protein